MNEKFFSLPQEKQQAILNGGYRVFSQNSYRKSPVSEIAAEAGISKSLLFHYFAIRRSSTCICGSIARKSPSRRCGNMAAMKNRICSRRCAAV